MKTLKCKTTGHEPDLKSLSICWDGDEAYIDINCKHCGESGCIGTVDTLRDQISWETDYCEKTKTEIKK